MTGFFALYVLNANNYKKYCNRAECQEYCAPFNRAVDKCSDTVLPQLDEDRREGCDVLSRSVVSVWESPFPSVQRTANSCY
jgi:hypothetical protein